MIKLADKVLRTLELPLAKEVKPTRERSHPSHSLPSGTLTFLLTDIEDSTRIWEQYPEQMRIAMARHDALIESAVEGQYGQLIRPRGEGDSRFAVFPRATDAIRAALAIQRLLNAESWTTPPLRVRIGLHSGEADLRDGDYYGSTVNRCARLRSAAHGGQILVSESTHCLVRDELPTDVGLRDLGEHNLRSLKRPEHIFQLVAEDLPAEFPALITADQIHHNLPLALTSFIGREREIEELEQLLSQSRLLTVAGPGGAGKTRLVIQVAQNIQDFFPDGVWFIDLAPLSDATLLSHYIMNELGMPEEAGYSPDQTLLDNLRRKTLLLILDNCEHLLPDATRLVETMLHSAPRLQVLATSREKLGATGEVTWRIPPLSSPASKDALDPENLMHYEAVKLFLDRAVSVRSGFALTRENAQAVAQICAHLDGIPLAIELAAARVRVLSVEEILARLDDRFRLLVGNQHALPRQQTLRALVDWSYDLLTEKERKLLRRLSMFVGGWTLDAAEQVCSGEEIEPSEVLDLLTSLIDKSFVVGEAQNGHERFRFLETILKFSQERMRESGETDKFGQKYALYFLKLANDSYGLLWGAEQAHWLGVLDEENDNLRTALVWLSKTEGNEDALLKMAGSLWKYWEIRGYFSEGRSWLETALARDKNGSEYWRANGLGGAGHLARRQGDYDLAKSLHEQSLSIFLALGCKVGAARQLNALGEIAQYLGDYPRSIELHEESLSLRVEVNDKEGIAVSLRQLGVIARDRGQYQHARELLEKSLNLERELGDGLLIALSLNDLGLVAHSSGDFKQAALLFEEAISMQRAINDRSGISNSLQNLGKVARDHGDFRQAELLLRECLEIKKGLGDRRGISQVNALLAEIAFWQGRYPLAADLVRQSLTLSQELGLKRVTLTALELLGFTAYYQGDFEHAASLAEETFSLSKELEWPRATGYSRLLMGLGEYSQGNLPGAKGLFQEAQEIFREINDPHSIAVTTVNLARTAYRLGDNEAAMHYLDESRKISEELNTRWSYGFVLEIMGLIERSKGNYERSLELFQESLRLSIEQENLQGIANCLGALAGLAVLANQARRAARFFAYAARLRREMGARMSNNDRLEYENYFNMVHEQLDHASLEAEWTDGFSMSTDKIIEELKEW